MTKNSVTINRLEAEEEDGYFEGLAGGITGLIRTRKSNAPDEDQSKSEHQIELTLSKIEQPGVEANERNSDERCHGSKPYYQPSEEPTGTR